MAWKDCLRRMPLKSSARKKSNRASRRDLDIKIQFMEGLVRRDPDYVDALQLLGDHYTQHGRYLDGLKVDEHLARLEPRSPLVFYNLACSCSLTAQFDRAASALETALQLGYRDFRWLAKDPDLHQLRQQPIYRDIEAKIRRMKVKVG
jgi:tetratricopeptide (TPR) repeat protein